jgi:hypothetical protein
MGREQFCISAPACNSNGKNTRSHTMDERNQVSGRSMVAVANVTVVIANERLIDK